MCRANSDSANSKGVIELRAVEAPRYRVDEDTKYRLSYFAEGQRGKMGGGPRLHSGGRYGVRLNNSGAQKPLNTQQIASFFGSLGCQRRRDTEVRVIPQPWLIGAHDGRFCVEGDVQLTSWNDPTASFAGDTQFRESLGHKLEEVRGNIDIS